MSKKQTKTGVPSIGKEKTQKELTDEQVRGALGELYGSINSLGAEILKLKETEKTINVKVALDGIPAIIKAVLRKS